MCYSWSSGVNYFFVHVVICLSDKPTNKISDLAIIKLSAHIRVVLENIFPVNSMWFLGQSLLFFSVKAVNVKMELKL